MHPLSLYMWCIHDVGVGGERGKGKGCRVGFEGKSNIGGWVHLYVELVYVV